MSLKMDILYTVCVILNMPCMFTFLYLSQGVCHGGQFSALCAYEKKWKVIWFKVGKCFAMLYRFSSTLKVPNFKLKHLQSYYFQGNVKIIIYVLGNILDNLSCLINCMVSVP